MAAPPDMGEVALDARVLWTTSEVEILAPRKESLA